MLALPERTIIGHQSWPPPLGSNHTGILISGNPTAKPTRWVGLNTARGIKVSRIKSAGDIDSSQAGPGAAMNQIGCTGTSNMKMRHPGCHHMMAWQLTATMVRGGNAGCLPPPPLQAISVISWLGRWYRRCYAMVGSLGGQREGLRLGPLPSQHKAASQAAPGTVLQLSLDVRYAATCMLIA